MKNNERILYGIIITIAVFTTANFLGSKIQMAFAPFTFFNHTLMLIFSIGMIFGMKKHVPYNIAWPQWKKILKPILLGILAAIVVTVVMNILTKLSGGKVEAHIAFTKMSPLQIFIFVFFYASIAEEILFRGFLLNILKSSKTRGIKIFKRNISLPVLISAVAFGLAHLTLLTTGAGAFFILRIVIFTTLLGLIAGYYQEKHDNNAFAIIVHMAGNFMGVIGAILMSLNMQ
jgi:membrane protease YdiL (CAAX protease family)